MGLALSEEIAQQIETHYLLLAKWSAKMNLTAVRDPVEAAHLHGLDSLLFAEWIDPDAEDRTVDVGSGAGFPGIPLALARPKLQMVLLEPIRKRASFLRVALAELDLPGVRVIEGRLEAGEGKKGPWPADLDRFPRDHSSGRAGASRHAQAGGRGSPDPDVRRGCPGSGRARPLGPGTRRAAGAAPAGG